MPRKLTGIRRKGNKLQAYVQVNGQLHTKSFDLATHPTVMTAWRLKKKGSGRRKVAAGSFPADVEAYLAKPQVAARPYVKQTRAHLSLWVAVLGTDRTTDSITQEEIERVIQRWLTVLAAPTVYHRRSSLLSFFVTLNGEAEANPVRGTTCPAAWIPRDQSVDFATLTRIVAAMPDYRYVKKAVRAQSIAKLVATIMLHTGVRPVDLSRVRRADFQPARQLVLMPPGRKGEGTEQWPLTLSSEGLASFHAFDAANGWGRFNPEAVSHSFKRAARRIDGAATTIHLYSERHSVGADAYRQTRDLATVGRLLGHADGSRATAQYARGAHEDVDRAAVAALGAARLAALGTVHAPEQSLPKSLPVISKSRQRRHLRRVS